jgi:hypothetical protein
VCNDSIDDRIELADEDTFDGSDEDTIDGLVDQGMYGEMNDEDTTDGRTMCICAIVRSTTMRLTASKRTSLGTLE